MFNGSYPGMLWNWQDYDPRFPFVRNAGDVRMLSAVPSEIIQPGNLVQVVPGSKGSAPVVRNARDATAIVGVASLDPRRYDPRTWVWGTHWGNLPMPVVRRGRVYCTFQGNPPTIGQKAFLVSPGVLATAGIDFGRACFQCAADAYYDNQDTSLWGAADTIPSPAPNPPGVTDTLFGEGCALLELNL